MNHLPLPLQLCSKIKIVCRSSSSAVPGRRIRQVRLDLVSPFVLSPTHRDASGTPRYLSQGVRMLPYNCSNCKSFLHGFFEKILAQHIKILFLFSDGIIRIQSPFYRTSTEYNVRQGHETHIAEQTHIVGFHVYFDEKRIRPILKQEKAGRLAFCRPANYFGRQSRPLCDF